MNNIIETKMDGAKHWVKEFNTVPQSLIGRAFENNIDNWTELTVATKGDYVYSDIHNGTYEVSSIDIENNKVTIDVDGENIEVSMDDISLENDSWLPMWGWLWSFSTSLDDEWVSENLHTVSSCGFRIFRDEEENSIYLGIDGAGYDFYDQHWLPLYEARGLQWHTNEN